MSAAAIAGGEHTLYHDKRQGGNGRLYSTGACGLGWCRLLPLDPKLFGLRPVPLPSPGHVVTQVHASYYHNLAVVNHDKLYSWGCGTFVEGGADGVIPALGDGDREDRGAPPQRVTLPDFHHRSDRIKRVTGGAYHSAVLTESGRLLTFGAGQLGQLGRPLHKGDNDASGLPVDPTPRQVPMPADATKVTEIGAAFYNTFALCTAGGSGSGSGGGVYCAGENQNRQCGVGDKNLHAMTRVAELDDHTVAEVEGGYCHTLVRTVAGTVLSLGCGDDGQRGDGRVFDDDDDEERRPTVTSVSLPVPAAQVAAGANHSVVLGTDGVAYTFGANDVGQCGAISPFTGSRDDDDDEGGPVLSPTAVTLPPHVGKVVDVSAGYAHTVLTTVSGKVFVFGQNDNGQLGDVGKTATSDLAQGKDPEAQRTPVEMEIPASQ